MNVFIYFSFGLLSIQVQAANIKLKPGCYDGSIHPKICCIGVTDWQVHLPNPKNCNKFYHCDNGKAVHKTCSENLHWSVKEDHCEWPEIANCKAKTSTTTTTEENIPTTETFDFEEDFVGALDNLHCFEEDIPAETCCQIYPTSKFPNNKDCSSYYECAHGVLVLKQCRFGFYWNKKLQKCDKNNTQCNNLQSTPKPEIKDQDLIIFPNERQCYEQDIPDIKCCVMLNSKFPNKKDCSSYYHCENDNIVLKKCRFGLHYNQKTEQCSLPHIAKCQINPDINIGTRVDPKPTKGQGNKSKSVPKKGKIIPKSISLQCLYGASPADECCKQIQKQQVVMLQNNQDCHTFIQCVNQRPVVRPCPSNLWWSVVKNRCESREKATCTWLNSNIYSN